MSTTKMLLQSHLSQIYPSPSHIEVRAIAIKRWGVAILIGIGNSYVKFVPYSRNVIEYKERSYVERVPVKKTVVQLLENKIVESVPR